MKQTVQTHPANRKKVAVNVTEPAVPKVEHGADLACAGVEQHIAAVHVLVDERGGLLTKVPAVAA
jgi:hypothetical protein